MSNSVEVVINLSTSDIEAAYATGETISIIDGIKSLVDENRIYDMTNKADISDCRTMAVKIGKAKSAIEKFGADELRTVKATLSEKVTLLSTTKKAFAEELKELQAKVRQPLTEYEDIRKGFDAQIKEMIAMREVTGMPASSIRIAFESLETYRAVLVTEDYTKKYFDAFYATKDILVEALAIAEKSEADQVELDKLRAESSLRKTEDAIEEKAKEKATAIAGEMIIGQVRADAAPIEKAKETTKDHKKAVHSRIIIDLMNRTGIPKQTANLIVSDIAFGNISHLSIEY